jgi:hypothetical protein
MDVLCVLIKTFVLTPLKIKYPASNHAIMDYVRYTLIGFRTFSDLVSQICLDYDPIWWRYDEHHQSTHHW